mmetsp:Transcript_36943/g.110663  ORF Transcript_36943/g.110663 Transcript_36943/m.110663 type:complete len:268 (-) Transcript_36943:363-1166(-)
MAFQLSRCLGPHGSFKLYILLRVLIQNLWIQTRPAWLPPSLHTHPKHRVRIQMKHIIHRTFLCHCIVVYIPPFLLPRIQIDCRCTHTCFACICSSLLVIKSQTGTLASSSSPPFPYQQSKLFGIFHYYLQRVTLHSRIIFLSPREISHFLPHPTISPSLYTRTIIPPLLLVTTEQQPLVGIVKVVHAKVHVRSPLHSRVLLLPSEGREGPSPQVDPRAGDRSDPSDETLGVRTHAVGAEIVAQLAEKKGKKKRFRDDSGERESESQI